ncbi:hypothetical protein A1D22_09350 [Pasteurellaceae bacterium LFhippo2]|nr:hypothetical protein [Pasteurellaceae bacterium LFhippo2]
MNKRIRNKARWRMSRNLRKKRTNFYMLEQRVENVARKQDMVDLDLENTHDLLSSLEKKVNLLVRENKQLKTQQMKSEPLVKRMWQGLLTILCSKGNP